MSYVVDSSDSEKEKDNYARERKFVLGPIAAAVNSKVPLTLRLDENTCEGEFACLCIASSRSVKCLSSLVEARGAAGGPIGDKCGRTERNKIH